MSNSRKFREKRYPKAIVCGMLEDNGRIFFLKQIGSDNIERFEVPHVLIYSGDPVSQLNEEFKKQTGIDSQVEDIILETKVNAGSRKKKFLVPCLVFRILAKNKTANLDAKFSGFKWLSLEDAKKQRLHKNSLWILSATN